MEETKLPEKYQAVRFEGVAQVIHSDKGFSNAPVCSIPTFYENDLAIAESIASLMNAHEVELYFTV